MGWRVFAATAIGKSHIDAGTPCQDAFAQQVLGDVLVACVCDGAGSQPLSHEGAQSASRDIVAGLAARLGAEPALRLADAATVQAAVAETVVTARTNLERRGVDEGVPLASFSATVVGAVVGADGGFFFHIGDGVCAAVPTDAAQPDLVSLPENGEYANETYFLTGEEWRQHLRVDTFAVPVGTVALMSDGAAPFVMAKGNAGLFRAFLDPVTRFLDAATDDDGTRGLAATLEDPRTWTITGDDKCLLLARWR